ncbi:hypothetical protein MNBD_ALPHA06-111 [hydrothermal vent metagenome]|uniref:LysM domain-containing protein n=1 Tax=hydrothermal vent metagenome TaxID=652676 RepID=A0A3B0R9U5_9ZZZZ
MIRKLLPSFAIVVLLSACSGGSVMAPVVYKGGGNNGSGPVAKAETPLTLPIDNQSGSADAPAAITSVDSDKLSEADELEMLDVDPEETATTPPTTKAEGLSEADELAMLDEEPQGLAPVDLRPKVDSKPSPEVTKLTYPVAISTRPFTEQEIVPTRDRPASIKVQSGDTLFSLSEKYQVALEPLIDLNDLRQPYGLNKGQTLKLPPPLHYRVQKGDTLYSIAKRYQIHFQSLAGINGVEEPFAISPDTILVLPTLARDKQGKWKAAPEEMATSVKPDGKAATSAPGSKPKPKFTPKPKPKLSKPAATSTFIWPLQGEILSKFGGKDGGLRNDGINIKAVANAPIHAAGAGTVIYSGAELKNFGRLILIRHGNGWVTAYAHNAESKVREGAKVTSGQVIALAGSSGSVDRPQLHFETRKGVKPVDPLRHLPKL